ncbi:glutaminyl-tRNA synthase (glutamine-hydrolyzing) subunit A [Candidatus Gottesmanbacteria bacterium RIFCSPLOWO2_01_FULL_39_12b]|uniref:Glutamyl-tRNA(Gln) amidotransferase subunit A n=1 Tax=Candidatus Gottesmanbacteria bacterium RIFCSPLOWO2_01_FULL_39_12b TaxID=1798388 RepID=A0A1F6AQP5_9BACT|nr:MAG: glutaminyl-tRNA synthase (glutamine-hydrolyzing) subunit A [Candidatus Gottesmanbacteria bacterium RIFCSPLOWO2_01_FULL_39_12b]
MLLDKSIKELSEGLKKRDFSSEEIVLECFENIEKHNKEINAFITVIEKKEAIKQAKDKDKKLSDDINPLYGLPFVLKDSYLTSGILTTSASKVLGNHIGQYNATVYQKLLDAGGILIGKMNMDAWGHGGSSENTDFDPVKNPWNTNRVAGGSSGGPAAAIACRMAVFAIGEDTGGSIRNPSAWCNIAGLKVTYGRVSRYGCIAYASSFDTVGPMAKTVEDCAYVLKTIAGHDVLDATSSSRPVPDYVKEANKNLPLTVIGLPKEFFREGLDEEIKKSIGEAVKVFQSLGLKIKEISMPMLEMSIPVYYLIGPSETSSNLARYDGVRYGNTRDNFTRETMRRIMLGTYALSAGYYDAYYKKAQAVRTLLIKEYEKALNECDVLLMPVNPTPPPKIGELISDPVKNLLADIFTTSQNPVGVPSLALPCGFTNSGLPIGMQIVGKMYSEALLLQLGHHFQKKIDWHTRKPNL